MQAGSVVMRVVECRPRDSREELSSLLASVLQSGTN